MKSDIFKFLKQFQRQLLRLLFVDREFLAKYSVLIKPFYFEEFPAELLCDLLFKYFNKYNNIPGVMAIKQELLSLKTKQNAGFNEKMITEVEQYFDHILSEEVTDINFIEDNVMQFAKNQAIKKFILNTTAIALRAESDADYNEIWEKLEEAMSVGADLQDLGIDFFAEDQIIKRIEDRKGGIRKNAIPLGVEHLDNKLHGGVCSGELLVLLAPSGKGKSIILTAFGSHALRCGKTVFHYTLELSERVVTNRYDSCLSKIKYHDLNNYPEKVRMRLETISKKNLGKLYVKWFPGGGETTMRDIVNHVKIMKIVHGVEPDEVIIDYGDELDPSARRYKEHWISAGRVFKEMCNFAVRYDKPVLTATQTNIGAEGKELITVKDIGESYKKVKVSDIILAFCQTDDEKDNNKGRLYTAKVRDDEDNYLTYVELDKSRIRLTWDDVMQEVRSKK